MWMLRLGWKLLVRVLTRGEVGFQIDLENAGRRLDLLLRQKSMATWWNLLYNWFPFYRWPIWTVWSLIIHSFLSSDGWSSHRTLTNVFRLWLPEHFVKLLRSYNDWPAVVYIWWDWHLLMHLKAWMLLRCKVSWLLNIPWSSLLRMLMHHLVSIGWRVLLPVWRPRHTTNHSILMRTILSTSISIWLRPCLAWEQVSIQYFVCSKTYITLRLLHVHWKLKFLKN